MIPEDLMRKYKYGYVHSCEILNEPFIKDLIKENQELKKQLEESRLNHKQLKDLEIAQLSNSYQTEKLIKLENQQKEFMEYLEDKINKIRITSATTSIKPYAKKIIPLIECLQKYKEIIGIK